jgi:hypothetical protein
MVAGTTQIRIICGKICDDFSINLDFMNKLFYFVRIIM